MESTEVRPADGWLFIEPTEADQGIVKKVSYGLDTCAIERSITHKEPRPIELAAVGWIAIRAESVTNWGQDENFQLERS